MLLLPLLLTGCRGPAPTTAEPRQPHIQGTWVGLAQFGTAHPPLDWEGGTWPIVTLRNTEGPAIAYPDVSEGREPRPATTMTYPPPPLVDHRDYIIEMPGIAPGTKLAVSGTMYGKLWPMVAPGDISVTTVEPEWAFGQPVVRVDKVERIDPDGRRHEVDWRRVTDQVTAKDERGTSPSKAR